MILCQVLRLVCDPKLAMLARWCAPRTGSDGLRFNFELDFLGIRGIRRFCSFTNGDVDRSWGDLFSTASRASTTFSR